MISPLSVAADTAAAAPPGPLADFVDASGLLAVLIGVSRDPNAKVTVLLVSPQTRRAVMAVKAPTTDRAARAVEAERRILRELPRLLTGAILDTVPRFLHTVDFDGRPAIVASVVPGVPMTMDYLRRDAAVADRAHAHFAAVERWLGSLQLTTAGRSRPIDMDGGVGALLETRFGDDRRLSSELDTLAEIHERLRRHAVPRTVVHGDLWFGNLFLERDEVSGVVDWEEAQTRGEPVRDLARFAVAYALYLDWRTRTRRGVRGLPGLRASGWGAGVEFGLSGAGWFPDLFRRFLQNGLERLGASPDLWRDVVLAGVAEMAARADDDAFGRRNLTLFRRLSVPDDPRRSLT